MPEIPSEQYHIAGGDAWRVSVTARARNLDRTYIGDVLRLKLQEPNIVEGIVERKQASGNAPPVRLNPFPLKWPSQQASNRLHRKQA